MKGRPLRGGDRSPILRLLTWPFGAGREGCRVRLLTLRPSLVWRHEHVIYLWFLARRVAGFWRADGGFAASFIGAAVPGL